MGAFSQAQNELFMYTKAGVQCRWLPYCVAIFKYIYRKVTNLVRLLRFILKLPCCLKKVKVKQPEVAALANGLVNWNLLSTPVIFFFFFFTLNGGPGIFFAQRSTPTTFPSHLSQRTCCILSQMVEMASFFATLAHTNAQYHNFPLLILYTFCVMICLYKVKEIGLSQSCSSSSCCALVPNLFCHV